MNRTRWIIFAAVCIGLVAALFIFKQSAPEFPGDPAKVVQDDRVYGKKDSKVVFIEYGDFQCPSCENLYAPLHEVKEQYKDKVAFVFRHVPIVSAHANAKAAAAAAEAANKQGKFWEMHDLLYENQANWSNAQGNNRSTFFEGYAKQLGLNIEQFKKDVASREVLDRINRDFGALSKAKLEPSTPTVVINGQKIEGSSLTITDNSGRSVYNADKIRAELDKALKAVGETPPSAEPATPEQSQTPQPQQ